MNPFETAWTLLKMSARGPVKPPKEWLARKRAEGMAETTAKPWDNQLKRRNEESTWAFANRQDEVPHSEVSDDELKQRLSQQVDIFHSMKENYPQMNLPDDFVDWMFQNESRSALWDEHISRQNAVSQE